MKEKIVNIKLPFVIIFSEYIDGYLLTKRAFPKEKYPNDYYLDEEYPGYKVLYIPPLDIYSDDIEGLIEYLKDEWIRYMTEEDKENLKKEMEKYDKLNKDFIIKSENGKYL